MTRTSTGPALRCGPRVGPRVLVIGCGQEHRRDDQIGLRIAEGIARNSLPAAEVQLCTAPGRDLLDRLDQADLLVLIDAARSGPKLPPGDWTRIDYQRNLEQLPARAAPDTHVMNVESVLRLGQTLGILPGDVWIYAVAIRDAGLGQEISAELEAAAVEVRAAVERDVSAWLAENGAEACTNSP